MLRRPPIGETPPDDFCGEAPLVSDLPAADPQLYARAGSQPRVARAPTPHRRANASDSSSSHLTCGRCCPTGRRRVSRAPAVARRPIARVSVPPNLNQGPAPRLHHRWRETLRGCPPSLPEISGPPARRRYPHNAPSALRLPTIVPVAGNFISAASPRRRGKDLKEKTDRNRGHQTRRPTRRRKPGLRHRKGCRAATQRRRRCAEHTRDRAAQGGGFARYSLTTSTLAKEAIPPSRIRSAYSMDCSRSP